MPINFKWWRIMSLIPKSTVHINCFYYYYYYHYNYHHINMNQANILPTGVKLARESENKKKRSRFFSKKLLSTHIIFIFSQRRYQIRVMWYLPKEKKNWNLEDYSFEKYSSNIEAGCTWYEEKSYTVFLDHIDA